MKKTMVLLVLVLCVMGCDENKGVKVGQVWKDPGGSKDPFDIIEPEEREVLAVKDGYVQYRWGVESYRPRGFISSSSCSSFKWNRELVESEPKTVTGEVRIGASSHIEDSELLWYDPNAMLVWDESDTTIDWTAVTSYSDVTIQAGPGEIVLEFKEDRLEITKTDNADMNEAAEVFFDYYIKPMADAYISENYEVVK